MSNSRQKTVLTTGQVARICNVAPRTVSKWFDSGQLRGYRIPGSKDRRIPVDQLVRFMKAHGIPTDGLDVGVVRVLLVDEDPELGAILSQALSTEGDFEVTTASSAFEAGVLAERLRPAVIVVDVSLSDVSPDRMCRTVRASDQLQEMKLIATSGALTEGHGQQLVQEGFAAFLPKPFDARQLRNLIETVSEPED
jgi:excisionase family DNA binding protein